VAPGSQPQDSETWDDAHWTEAKAAVFSIQYVNYFNPIPVGLCPFSFLVEKAPLEAILSVSQSLM
jgi:hypothetical protein